MSSTSEKRGWMLGDFFLGNMWWRVVVLGCAVLGGFFLGQCISPWLLCFFPDKPYGDTRTVIGAIPFTLPTFLALWWFRTYDTRQQNLRANFDTGVGHIASDTPIRIEIGAKILINVSQATSSYDREISTAFIRRLKRFPAETDANRNLLKRGYRFAYAQHMLKWLKDRGEKHELELLDLRYQEFTSTTASITASEILAMHREDYVTIDVACCNFENPKRFFGAACDVREKWEKCEYGCGCGCECKCECERKCKCGCRKSKPFATFRIKVSGIAITMVSHDCKKKSSANNADDAKQKTTNQQ